MKPLVFSQKARSDLRDIALYIADDNPERAQTYVDELIATAGKAAERPLSFPARDDISLGLRSALHGRYLIFFRNLSDHVRIVRILHGSRDLNRLLSE